MKKNFLILILLAVAAAVLILAVWFGVLNKKAITKVCLDKSCYQVELALTPQDQALGLMFRKSLDKDKGMFFKFPQDGVYPFWMKNTLIPLDIIWIGSDKKIVFISRDTASCASDPCPLTDPGIPASYVLEINAGEIARIGAKIGDEVSF